MYRCITPYQMEDADQLIIHIHGEQRNYRTLIQQFINEKQAILDKNKSKLKIEIDYMIELKKRPPENLISKE
ncbi:hypothetical protein BsIDN1_46220 [Bacillus safensis]|uniref:Uncharacterized protein n=1 Tax=Bacillus safensis TaxID=561879 RepID=A0A5S9MFT7_BACIA|nr:hypothetical protein BsIDN1_46220 [Bacillus safensis]